MPRVNRSPDRPRIGGKGDAFDLAQHAPSDARRLAVRGALREVHQIQRSATCGGALIALQNASFLLGEEAGIRAARPSTSRERPLPTIKIDSAALRAVVQACRVDPDQPNPLAAHTFPRGFHFEPARNLRRGRK